MDFFNKNFANFIFMYNKEKNKTVAVRFAKYILLFREALGSYQLEPIFGNSGISATGKLEEMLQHFLAKFGKKS
jgi:hypothetical protein